MRSEFVTQRERSATLKVRDGEFDRLDSGFRLVGATRDSPRLSIRSDQSTPTFMCG